MSQPFTSGVQSIGTSALVLPMNIQDWFCLGLTGLILDFPGGSDSKEYAYNAGDPGSIPRLGRSSRERNGYPLQYTCQENSMDIGVWWAILHGVTKSQMKLKDTCSLEVKL